MTDGNSSRPVSLAIAPDFEGLTACIGGDLRLKVTRTELGPSGEEPVNPILSDESHSVSVTGKCGIACHSVRDRREEFQATAARFSRDCS